MKLLKIIILLLFSYSIGITVYSANLETINVGDNKNVEFKFDKSTSLLSGSVDTSDIKIYKDIPIAVTMTDIVDNKKITLDLSGELLGFQNYSLLNILGPEGNMDFSTGLSIQNRELKNDTGTGQYISRIVLRNSKTIELYYNQPIKEDEFEYKLLSEVKIENLTVTKQKITISLLDKLEEYSNYMVMLLSIKDSLGNELEFDEDLYEFFTESFLVPEKEKSIEKKGDPKKEENQNNTGNVKQDNVEMIALNAPEIPETGTDTWLLILGAIIINFIFILRKKIFQ